MLLISCATYVHHISCNIIIDVTSVIAIAMGIWGDRHASVCNAVIVGVHYVRCELSGLVLTTDCYASR